MPSRRSVHFTHLTRSACELPEFPERAIASMPNHANVADSAKMIFHAQWLTKWIKTVVDIARRKVMAHKLDPLLTRGATSPAVRFLVDSACTARCPAFYTMEAPRDPPRRRPGRCVPPTNAPANAPTNAPANAPATTPQPQRPSHNAPATTPRPISEPP